MFVSVLTLRLTFSLSSRAYSDDQSLGPIPLRQRLPVFNYNQLLAARFTDGPWHTQNIFVPPAG